MKTKIYLDNAATTFPKPEAVYCAVDEANRNYAVNAGRGSYTLAQKAEDIMEKTRNLLKDLAGAGEETEVVLTPSATLACNQILGGLEWKKTDVVYISPYEHNAVVRVLYLLQKRYGFEMIELPVHAQTLELDLEKTRYQFFQKPPSVLCMTQISNVTGYLLPVEEVLSFVEDQDTVVVVDGSQALGLVPLTLKNSRIDYYIFAGHKTLYGPLGIGGFFYRSGKRLHPVFAGGTGTDSLKLEMPSEIPDAYEPGSPNIPAIAGLYRSLKEFKETPSIREDLLKKEQELIGALEDRLHGIPNVHTYLSADKKRQSGICSFVIEGYQSEDVGMILDEDYGIAVRCGYHCAPLIHRHLNDEAYGGTTRVSVGRFNTIEEIEMLAKAVEEIAEG